MLELKNIRWSLPDGEEILKGIDLTVPDGQLTVITGPNGGGKTSLAKIIAGLEVPDCGSIVLDGTDITKMSITGRSRFGVGYAFQQPVRFKGVTVRDLLELAAGESLNEEQVCSLLGKVGICAREYIDRDVDASLSGGESKRIEIATVLARHNSKITVFDEPEAGIDLWSFSSLIDAFKALKEEHGESLLIISHQERIMEIADNIVVIADGRVQKSGKKEEVIPELLENNRGNLCPLGKDVREV